MRGNGSDARHQWNERNEWYEWINQKVIWMNECINEGTKEWRKKEWISEGMKKLRVKESRNKERINEGMKKWKDEGTKERNE